MLNQSVILGVVRHVLTFGGGFLTSNGMATEDDISAAVGAVVVLVGVVWSIVQKKKPE